MNIDFINKLKKNDYLLLLPKSDYDIRDGVEYSFDNVLFLESALTDEQIKTIIDTINDKDLSIILFEYDDVYRKILPYLRKKINVKWVIKYNLAAMTDENIRMSYFNMVEFVDRNIVNAVGCLDKNAYKVLKNAGYNAFYINLDVEKSDYKSKESKTIGLIGNDYNPNHNVYNELSALKLIDYDYIKMIKIMPATREFIQFFDIKDKDVDTLDEAMKDNMINLYCNFTGSNNELVLKSMDMGVPCLLGNSDLFDEYKTLKKYLVLKSDDDIGEIADKINLVIKNKNEIMKEYSIFRKDYTNKSKENVKNFLK